MSKLISSYCFKTVEKIYKNIKNLNIKLDRYNFVCIYLSYTFQKKNTYLNDCLLMFLKLLKL